MVTQVNVMEEAVKEGGKKEQQAELGRIVKCLEEANAILDKVTYLVVFI